MSQLDTDIPCVIACDISTGANHKLGCCCRCCIDERIIAAAAIQRTTINANINFNANTILNINFNIRIIIINVGSNRIANIGSCTCIRTSTSTSMPLWSLQTRTTTSADSEGPSRDVRCTRGCNPRRSNSRTPVAIYVVRQINWLLWVARARTCSTSRPNCKQVPANSIGAASRPSIYWSLHAINICINIVLI